MTTFGKASNSRLRGGWHSSGTKNRAATPAEARIQELLPHKGRPAAAPNSSSTLASVEDDAISQAATQQAQPKTLTVLVADDHPLVREGVVSLINRQPGLQVIAEAGNGREAVEKFLELRPDVALLDLRMPLMDGVDAIASICRATPSARTVILTTYPSEEEVYRALRAGALGYLLKASSVEELVTCIHAVGGGKAWIPPAVGAQLAKRVAVPDLTPREMDVLRTIAAGKSNKEIGVAFGISEATVKVHVTHILEKLKVTGRTEAINVAAKRGLIYLDAAVA